MPNAKRMRDQSAKIDRNKLYDANEAFELARECASVKFDESVDAAVRLAVDPRKADQNIRGSVVLPHGTGKTMRVAVFAKGEKAKEAEDAGADIVGAEDLVARIKDEGFLDFDVAIATPDMMKVVARVGRILGPRGLMPNPKVGSVTFDVAPAVKEAKGGKVDFRVDKAGIIHAGIGRASFDADKLAENLAVLVDQLMRMKPPTAKGNYLRSVTVSTTMGPGIRVDVSAY